LPVYPERGKEAEFKAHHIPGLEHLASAHLVIFFHRLLTLPKPLDGTSIRPLLEKPSAPWDQPAITTWLFNNHTVRTERWRYIRYADGGEELYDHDKDPLEWTNLAGEPEFSATKTDLAKLLPSVNKPFPARVPKSADTKKKKAKKTEKTNP
jgi:hypothetical protein